MKHESQPENPKIKNTCFMHGKHHFTTVKPTESDATHVVFKMLILAGHFLTPG